MRLADHPHFLPIATAPRTGALIIVGADDAGTFPMRWDGGATNDLFAPGVVGMWVLFDGTMTWRDDQYGPTHWQPCVGEISGVN